MFDQIRLKQRIACAGPKKVLSIDGGGIRGILALEILARIEASLRARSSHPDEFVLADYFDAIGGTSTGAIIATGLSLGYPVQKLIDFYINSGDAMFQRAAWYRRFRYKFDREPLADMLKQEFGDRSLGSDDLRTLLLVVMRNATTDSPWPVINNPYARYNDGTHPGCNLALPLWQLVRASTAAPSYFPPEQVTLGDREFIFVDGGVTMYNNPAFQLFLMLTVDRYWQRAPAELVTGWATGADKMLLVSIGTGTSPGVNDRLSPGEMNLLFDANTIPSALMLSALSEQDQLCRMFGDAQAGDQLDREIGTLIGSRGPIAEKLFRYVRYNAELTAGGLQAIGCTGIEPKMVQQMDNVAAIPDLRRVGSAVAALKVQEEHFDLAHFPVT